MISPLSMFQSTQSKQSRLPGSDPLYFLPPSPAIRRPLHPRSPAPKVAGMEAFQRRRTSEDGQLEDVWGKRPAIRSVELRLDDARAGCPVQSGLELAQGRRRPALQLQKEDPGHAHDGQYSKTHGTAHALKPKTSLQEHTTLRAIPTQSALRRSRRCRKLREHNLMLSCVLLRWMDPVARRGSVPPSDGFG